MLRARRKRLVVVAAVVVLAGGAGCSLLVSASDYAGGPSKQAMGDGGDANDADALPERDGDADGEASADAGPADAPNLLSNGDFELGCTAWLGEADTLADEDTTVRSGKRACRVCTSFDAGFVLRQDLHMPVTAGESFVAEAYVRVPPGDAGVSGGPTQSSLATYGAMGVALESSPSTGPLLDGTWQRMSVLLGTTVPATELVLRIESVKGPGCILVDDARLYRRATK